MTLGLNGGPGLDCICHPFEDLICLPRTGRIHKVPVLFQELDIEDLLGHIPGMLPQFSDFGPLFFTVGVFVLAQYVFLHIFLLFKVPM